MKPLMLLQLVICLRWVDELLEVHEEFVGLYEIPNIKADTIFGVIMDTLTRLNLALVQCRGQCYDGASNMSGCKSGIAASISALESKALFTHCYGHSLACSWRHSIKMLEDVLDIEFEISGLIKFSPKCNAQFDSLKKDIAPGSPVLRPTRLTVRSLSLKSVIDNYAVLQALWDECLEEQLKSDVKARIIGSASSNDFSLSLAYLILKHTDNLSATLQSKDMSVTEGQEVTSMTEGVAND